MTLPEIESKLKCMEELVDCFAEDYLKVKLTYKGVIFYVQCARWSDGSLRWYVDRRDIVPNDWPKVREVIRWQTLTPKEVLAAIKEMAG